MCVLGWLLFIVGAVVLIVWMFRHTRITIIGGKNFPQGRTITLNINGSLFTGKFNGTAANPTNVFDIMTRRHPRDDGTGNVIRKSLTDLNLFRQELPSMSHCIGYKPTHYIYLHGPENIVEPTGMMDLSTWNAVRRRDLIHQLLGQGELLAKIPDGLTITSMSDLREYLTGGSE